MSNAPQKALEITSSHDVAAVRCVHEQAFGAEGTVVADLACELLVDPSAAPVISLLAAREQRLVGHVLFTRAHAQHGVQSLAIALLAPLGVVPSEQRRGVGARLIREGVDHLRGAKVDLVFVLGDPAYYGRHGFRPARALGYETPQPILPEHADAWQVRELRAGALGEGQGVVRCALALDRPEHWR